MLQGWVGIWLLDMISGLECATDSNVCVSSRENFEFLIADIYRNVFASGLSMSNMNLYGYVHRKCHRKELWKGLRGQSLKLLVFLLPNRTWMIKQPWQCNYTIMNFFVSSWQQKQRKENVLHYWTVLHYRIILKHHSGGFSTQNTLGLRKKKLGILLPTCGWIFSFSQEAGSRTASLKRSNQVKGLRHSRSVSCSMRHFNILESTLPLPSADMDVF